MSDNIDVSPSEESIAVSVATDYIGGIHYPIYKVSYGALGEQIPVTALKPLPVAPNVSKTAFGEQSVEEKTSIVNLQFAYNTHAQLVKTMLNHGSVSVANSLVTLSTGASANQSAQLFSKIPVKYYTGLGGLVRFTTVYSTSVAGSAQLHGIGDSGDGYFFGYNGVDFGILRRYGGNPEFRSLQITTGSTTDENITITLDGDSDATVAVTNTGDATLTANEIAAHDYSNLGRGWSAVANGDTVEFSSWNSEPRAGSYAISATTAAGTYSQDLAGISPTDDWTLQANWSEDIMDGSGPSGQTLVPTKGNVFQIRYQWLGFGQICFFIEDSDTGEFKIVHRISYANLYTIPSVQNPTLPLCMMVENTSNTTDLTMSSSSMAGFIEGKQPEPLVRHTEIIDKIFSDATLVPVVTGHNSEIFKGKLNRVRVKVESVSVSVESGKPVIIQIKKNTELTGASFLDHDVDQSVVKIDTTATAVTNGQQADAFSVVTGGEKTRLVGEYLEVGEFITIEGAQSTSGTNSVCKIIIHWTEDF